MSRQYVRAEDRYRVATGQEPDMSYDERYALKEEQRNLQRRVSRALQKETAARQARQKAADATRQKVMDKHPEIKIWFWPEVR